MYFLLYIAIIMVIYVGSFKDNFKEEHIQKVAPVLSVVVLGLALLIILRSFMGK